MIISDHDKLIVDNQAGNMLWQLDQSYIQEYQTAEKDTMY